MSSFDLITIFIFGIIVYVFDKMKYSVAPIIQGLILGNMFDFRFRQTLITNNDSSLPFVTRPISLVFLLVIVFTIANQIIK